MSGIKWVDSGKKSLYPMNMMHENPQLRWSFIHKVYSIVTLQLLLTISVVSFVLVPSFANFFDNYLPNYVFFIVAIFATFSAMYYHQKHPTLSYFLLLICAVSLALHIGPICVLPGGKISLEAVILTTAAVIFSLTLYTFWAAKRGYDFSSLYTSLFGALLVLILFIPIQMLFPREKLSYMILIFGCTCLLFILICGHIVYNTDTLIKRISYTQYTSISVSLYLDVICLFLSLLILYVVLLFGLR